MEKSPPLTRNQRNARRRRSSTVSTTQNNDNDKDVITRTPQPPPRKKQRTGTARKKAPPSKTKKAAPAASSSSKSSSKRTSFKAVSPESSLVEINNQVDSPTPPTTFDSPPPSHLTFNQNNTASFTKNDDSSKELVPSLEMADSDKQSPSNVSAAAAEDDSTYYNHSYSESTTPSSSSSTITATASSKRLGNAHVKLFALLLLIITGCVGFLFPPKPPLRSFGHIIPPRHHHHHVGSISKDDTLNNKDNALSQMTLREFLMHPEGFHLGLAPAFFGFYGYFGMLAAWDEGCLVAEATTADTTEQLQEQHAPSYLSSSTNHIQSVAGASAGAMAAVLLALGIAPRKAADFCSTIDLATFADPPGIGAVFKGDVFEQLMRDFIKSETPSGHSLRLEDTDIPVAVTGFDLQTLQTHVMTKGNVARASRASATFPFLFQPVHWKHDNNDDVDDVDVDDNTRSSRDYILIDGGVLDPHGLKGLTAIKSKQPLKRVVNMVVGPFGGLGSGVPPGPSDMPEGLVTSELVSISIQNLPACGPWAMQNGPKAVEAAYQAMLASLDLPLYKGKEPGHYELHIDASSFHPS